MDLKPKLTVAQAELLARALAYGCVLLRSDARDAARLRNAGLIRWAQAEDSEGRYTVLRATPLGRWRALGGKRPHP